ncbi:PREDICTED: interferon alpha-1 [Myotis davidii]|uniref:interferon alpha-1 n=1 Tax=Myotis davidii TaxID=225400 RepID=UPI000766E277|nr:PREDICTED: interferon alpha-1 [Myotis davidii]
MPYRSRNLKRSMSLLLTKLYQGLGEEKGPSKGPWEIFTLLSQRERKSILSCLRDGTDLRFPRLLIFSLFSASGSFVTWDETLLDKLLHGLYQRLDDLETVWSRKRR